LRANASERKKRSRYPCGAPLAARGCAAQ
jgi:hypothetical protein